MTKNEHLFDLVSWSTLILGLSLADFKEIIYIIIGLISLITSLISGIISITLKIKNAMKDGNITDDEIHDITKQFDEVTENIESKINNVKEKIDERKDNNN